MKVLIIGSGGREHALAWKVQKSPLVTAVFVAPGNAGTALESGVQNVDIAVTDIAGLIAFAECNAIGLTIVGPEAALAAGVVDAFNAHHLPCFGPTKCAAQLESSKAFSKDFMVRHAIPTARYATFDDLDAAKAYLEQAQDFPLVIKADGLAAGKGVVIAQDKNEAVLAIEEMLSGRWLQSAGQRIVIEEFITGEEVSFIVLAAGEQAVPLATSQDHKARDDGDVGPNTGGMGAYSPARIVTSALQEKIMRTVIYPTLKGMAAEGNPYCGFLYAGLMITANQEIKVLEFNCRLGDPETQPIMMRLNSDLAQVCLQILDGKITDISLDWDSRAALGVVMASKGYPNAFAQGNIVEDLPSTDTADQKVFHAGTTLESGKVKTTGGRVFCVTALGDNISAAQDKAYALVKQIYWPNRYYRTDIGHRAIAKEMQNHGS